jgi:uncharacterized protein YgiB involved in biofilm formation
MKKRSSNLRLTLMVAAAPAVLLLSGCEADEPANTGMVLQTESQCDFQTDVPKDQCHTAYQNALAEHQRVAPQFADRNQCNDQFGACTEVRSAQGQASWVPPMTGFLLGYVASNLVNGARAGQDCQRFPGAEGCRGSSGSSGGVYRRVGGSSPLYRDYRTGEYRRPNGDATTDRAGRVYGDAGNTSVPARAVSVSRSGFGSSSAARSSFSSSRSNYSGGRSFGG